MLEIRHEYNGFDLDDQQQSDLTNMIEASNSYPEVGWHYVLDDITIKCIEVGFMQGLWGVYCLISFEEV